MFGLPKFPEKWMQFLDDKYPHKCPQTDEDIREIYFYAGKRALIDEIIGIEKRIDEGSNSFGVSGGDDITKFKTEVI